MLLPQTRPPSARAADAEPEPLRGPVQHCTQGTISTEHTHTHIYIPYKNNNNCTTVKQRHGQCCNLTCTSFVKLMV